MTPNLPPPKMVTLYLGPIGGEKVIVPRALLPKPRAGEVTLYAQSIGFEIQLTFHVYTTDLNCWYLAKTKIVPDKT